MPDFAVRTAFTAVDKISPAFSRMEKAAKGFGSVMSAVLPVLGVAVLANYASKAIDLASSLTEVQNVVDTTFGKDANQINQWSQNAINQFGLSELQAKQFTGSLGAMMKSSGLASDQIVKMSTDLSGLAGDFASFYNLPIEQAFEKIRSGISGETEPLKQLGINMSVANMEAFALTQGIRQQWKDMNQATQTQLRYAYLMKVSSDAQGDFNKTLATSYANQKRVLGVQFDQALAQLAMGILPSLTEAFKSLNEVMRAINWKAVGSVLTVILKVIPYVVGWFVAWKFAMIAWNLAAFIYTARILGIIGAMQYYEMSSKAITFLTKAWTAAQWLFNAAMTANPIGLIIVGIGALIAAGVALYRNWDVVTKFFSNAWSIVKEKFIAAGTIIWDWMKSFGRGFMTYMLFPINLLITGVIKLLELAASIPGVGEKFAKAAEMARNFQNQINATTGATNVFAPNRAATELQAGNTNVNIYSNGTEAKAEVTPRKGATVNMNRLGYQQ